MYLYPMNNNVGLRSMADHSRSFAKDLRGILPSLGITAVAFFLNFALNSENYNGKFLYNLVSKVVNNFWYP